MERQVKGKAGLTQKSRKKRGPLKRKKVGKGTHSGQGEPEPKKIKRDTAEPEFSHVRFKFLLRSPETVGTGLQTFLDMCGEVEEEEEEGGREGLKLLDSYLKSSPQCSEVLDMLTPKASPQEISLVFAWITVVLQKCPLVIKTFSELQQHLVKTLLARHGHLVVNSLRRGNKAKCVKSTLMMLIAVASLGHKFAKLLHTHLDFTHANWPSLLSRRDRKDEIDVRACMIAILMTLLQAEDEDLTRSLVEQRVLLQDVMLGLKYDNSEYVIHSLNTLHRCIVKNGTIGKNSKIYLFSSPVLKELLALYQWPGPSQWKRQPSDDEKMEYTEEQQKVAEYVHPLMVDLLTDHKLGICFRDRSYGISNENKNPVVSKVLQLLVTSYSSPLSHRLVTAVLRACPDQTAPFLRLLQPHLSPRPVDTWIAGLRFFLRIVENHEWPGDLMENKDMMTEERASRLVHFLFPPDAIVSSLKEGLKSPCATVRHQCLQALETQVTRGRYFHDISQGKLGSKAPLTLGIEGFVSKTLPNSQVLLNLLQKLSSVDSFAVPITRDLYKDKDVEIPHVSRFLHLTAILRMYSLAPEHLTGGPADTLPSLLQQVAQVVGSEEETDRPPEGTMGNLASLYMLHALSKCDARKLNLFGKGGNKGDPKSGLVYRLVGLMQMQTSDSAYTQTAQRLIGKLLAGTGLFDGYKEELGAWLRHLQSAESAPEEVVVFFVGLLRQYMSNPYPAIDRLLELVEETPQLMDGCVAGLRQEFSPLVMFALEGEFHTHRKVHQYVCSVLIDILHSLHKPWGFSRLVHSLSKHLHPDVTLYLTLHGAEEKLTWESMSDRLSKKLRMKQLKSFTHPGVTAIAGLLKGEEGVEKVMENLSCSACLPLVQLCLRYLDELVLGSAKAQGGLLNKKLGVVCLETLRAACLLQAKSTLMDTDIKNRNKSEESVDEVNHLELPPLETDWFQATVVCILGHPLVSQWLFEDGFREGGTPREELVLQLCDTIQLMHLEDRNMEMELPFDVGTKCHHMLQAASESAGASVVPESLQPLLCKCLETLFSVRGLSGRLAGLLTLLSLPMENLLSGSTPTQSPLVKTVCKLADQVQPNVRTLKNLSGRVDFESSVKGLLSLVSVVDHSSLVSLALSFVQSSPPLSPACTVSAFQGMLRRVEQEEASALLPLLECLMVRSAHCHSSCGHWLQKKKKILKQGKQLFHSIMLLYLRLSLTVEGSTADDMGVEAIRQTVRHELDSERLAVNDLDTTFLHVVCYLINLDKMGSSPVDTLQDHLVSAMREEADLHAAHVQLLAATLRHQSLRPSSLQHEGDNPGKGGSWDEFETQAGRVLVACVRYLTSSGMKRVGGDPERESCCGLLVHLCRDLLCLTLQPEERTAITSFWPDVVTCCLKYHYKEEQYIALLRQLVQKLFTEEETSKDDEVLDDKEDENATENLPKSERSDEESDSEEDEDDPEVVTPAQKTTNPKPESASKSPATTRQNFSPLSVIVSDTARRLASTNNTPVAKKCVALFGEENRESPASRQSQIVRRWTASTHDSFFLWPAEPTSLPSHRKMILVSLSDGDLMVDLCEKIVGHTGFLPVLQEEEQWGVRRELVTLLACLVRLHKSCCSVLPLNVLVAAYSTTLSLTDQNLLYLMFACDLHGNQRLSPGVWGEKAVRQLEEKKEAGRSLLHEACLEDILQLLDGDTMATSILHFPLLRPMEFRMSECIVTAEKMMSREECYDPRFLLQLFFHFMGPEHVVDVRSFIAQRGLGFTLAALSSHDWATRRLAVGVLANLHSQVEMVQRWSAAPILLAFLRVVMNAVTREGQKLPCVVTVFLAKVADLVMSPESDMYVAVHSFVMLKPALDVNNVPEFYNFFNSPNPKERAWVLRLLQDGLRETSDHRLFQRRFVYKLLMCHASSSLSDPQTRRESLKVLVRASSIATVVKDLVTKHGLLPWVLAFIKDYLSDAAEMTRLVCQLLHNVCYTPEFNQRRLWWLSLPRLSRKCLLHVPLLACVQLLVESFSHLEEGSLSLLEDILHHPHLTTPSAPVLLTQTPHLTTPSAPVLLTQKPH